MPSCSILEYVVFSLIFSNFKKVPFNGYKVLPLVPVVSVAFPPHTEAHWGATAQMDHVEGWSYPAGKNMEG